MDANLFASVTMKDSQGNVLGETPVNATYSLGMPINVGDPYAFLPNELASTPLIMTGKYFSEYINRCLVAYSGHIPSFRSRKLPNSLELSFHLG